MLMNMESCLSSLYKHTSLHGQNISAHFNIFQINFPLFPLIFNENTDISFFCHWVSFPATRIREKAATGSHIPCTELPWTWNLTPKKFWLFHFPSQQHPGLAILSHHWPAQDPDVSVLSKNVIQWFFPAASKPQTCSNPPSLSSLLPNSNSHYPLEFFFLRCYFFSFQLCRKNTLTAINNASCPN